MTHRQAPAELFSRLRKAAMQTGAIDKFLMGATTLPR